MTTQHITNAMLTEALAATMTHLEPAQARRCCRGTNAELTRRLAKAAAVATTPTDDPRKANRAQVLRRVLPEWAYSL